MCAARMAMNSQRVWCHRTARGFARRPASLTKSVPAALNAALGKGDHELVIRVDADVEVGLDAFAFTSRWFQDPLIGMVGALNLPSTGRTWFHRMRELECLWGFGFGRRTLQAVDGIGCVPGTYVAFRRSVARQAWFPMSAGPFSSASKRRSLVCAKPLPGTEMANS